MISFMSASTEPGRVGEPAESSLTAAQVSLDDIVTELSYVLASHPMPSEIPLGTALTTYIASRYNIADRAAGLLAWKVLLRVVTADESPVDLPSGVGLRPLAAARHLLGMVSYAKLDGGSFDRKSALPDISLTLEDLAKRKGQLRVSFAPFDPFGTAGQRRTLAVLAGGWQSKDPRSLLVPRQQPSQALRDLAAFVWDRFAAQLNTPDVIEPLVAEAVREYEEAASRHDASTDLVREATTGTWLPRRDAPRLENDCPIAGWGPDRATFTVENPAPYPSFNSITDNSEIGDERCFVALKKADALPQMLWQSHVWAQPGDEYVVRIYVHNSGSHSFGVMHAGWLQQAGLQLTLHSGPRGHAIHAYLQAVNAMTVWDGATIHTEPGTRLEWVPGTFEIENNAHPGGTCKLDLEAALDGGILLGYEEMDGWIAPGCAYASFVSVRVRVHASPRMVGRP